MTLYKRGIKFLIGEITLIANDHSLIEIQFKKSTKNDESTVLDIAEKEIKLFCEGKLKKFTVPFEMNGTEFQKKCWNKLLAIPYGEVISYKEQALKLGGENYCRAVAGANNKNKLPIIIPCHRVIGHDGKLVGYAGGINLKKKLLEVEGSI